MTRAANVLTEVRRALADPNAKRWSDERLLSLLNQQQRELASLSKVLKSSILVAVTPYTPIVMLPSNIDAVTRLEWEKQPLKLMSYSEMDQQFGDWQDQTAEAPTVAVYDLRTPDRIRIWPGMEWPSLSSYGLLTGVGEGTLADVVGTSETLDGAVAIGDITYGIVTTIDVPEYFLTIYYTYRPEIITDPATQELELPPIFDDALTKYIISSAFMDNLDTQSQQLADSFAVKGAASLTAARENKIIDYTTTTQYDTKYTGAF